MVIVYQNKGYTILEMLICMCIISLLLFVSLRNNKGINLEHYEFMNKYLLTQSQAILDKEDKVLEKGVYFYPMGKVNQARTIEFNNHKVIIHLGNGYITYE
jgi:prepilin-type N-terminal cleavage/methylation domain-containing protein